MRILVTGSKGQLGHEVVDQLEKQSMDVIPLTHDQIDIADNDCIQRQVAEVKPAMIINAAAYTKVDESEDRSDLAFTINQKGPSFLATACEKSNIPLIHISTDYVFDGEKKSPYTEKDAAFPINKYGKSKLDGENEIVSRLKKYIIIRTSWMYGVHGNNFVKTMLRLGKSRTEINVVSDQFGSPTAAVDLAEAIVDITRLILFYKKSAWGIYHYCGEGITNWHDFAKEIFQIALRKELMKMPEIHPVSSLDYPTKAKRPRFSALNCDKIKHSFGIHIKPWKERLEYVLQQIFSREV